MLPTDGVNNSYTMGYLPTDVANSYNSEDYILIAMYSSIFLIGVIGNGIVCYIFERKYKRELNTVETMIYYLAVSDMIGSIINPVLFIYWQTTFYEQWHFGQFGCKLLPSMARLTTDISACVIVIINIDRWHVICRPYKEHFSKKMLRMALFVCFVMSVISEIPSFVYQEVSKNSTCQVQEAKEPRYAYPRIVSHVIKDLLFIIVFIIGNYCIYKELYKKNQKDLQTKPSVRRKRKTFIVLATVSIVFMSLVFPRDILHIIYTISWLSPPGIKQTKAVLNCNSYFKTLHMCNSIYNIFIYARLHTQFKRRLFGRERGSTYSFSVTKKISEHSV